MNLVVYADASFANNEDHSNQLRFAIFLTDNTTHANALHYTSFKSKRVVQSVVGGELYAMADAYD